jgi:hypothetical protein
MGKNVSQHRALKKNKKEEEVFEITNSPTLPK